MDKSIFADKQKKPGDADLKDALGQTFEIWNNIHDYVYEKYSGAISEWNYSGDKFGWSYRIKDKKRVIVYFLPRDQFFKVAMVFGQKATEEILNSEIPEGIKDELRSTKVYAEGRGIRIVIENKSVLKTIKKLIDFKLAN